MKDYEIRFDATRGVPADIRTLIGDERADKGWPYVTVKGDRYYLLFEDPTVFMLKVAYDGKPVRVVTTEVGTRTLYWIGDRK